MYIHLTIEWLDERECVSPQTEQPNHTPNVSNIERIIMILERRNRGGGGGGGGSGREGQRGGWRRTGKRREWRMREGGGLQMILLIEMRDNPLVSGSCS